MSRRITLTVAACLAAGASLLAAPAHAAEPDTAVRASQSAEVSAAASDRVKCTSLSNGQLCISLNTGPSRIEVFYTKSGGSAITAELGFRSSSTDWGPTKTITTGERANTTWTMSYPCGRKYVGLIKVAGQGTFETPAATPPCG
ncbi:hypothetical protein EES43_06300 [Streptomyces sp. ADI96-02]|uniref:hypothetical protein n=1 Tax=unclassified Streptomyces TaxID=2593676 RepID=UPI000F552D00|nr:hypothetical protein [Streptomyces sp. ADI96-02]RPK66550.1 hypothetical protein EES43_06300 [Streptomyces sp. ADI96-02]